MASRHWSEAEVEAAVQDYLKMLTLEVSGQSFNKAERNRDAYQLYRVFEFRKRPKLFTLPGDVETHMSLRPINYRAYF